MRRSLVALLGPLSLTSILACDLQPPKREVVVAAAPPAPPPVAVIAADASVPTAPPTPDPGRIEPVIKPAAIEVSQACSDVASHVAEVVIASIKDPTQKAAFEQERTTLVKNTGETCARQSWDDATRACFLASKTADAVEACGRKLRPEPPPRPTPPPGGEPR